MSKIVFGEVDWNSGDTGAPKNDQASVSEYAFKDRYLLIKSILITYYILQYHPVQHRYNNVNEILNEFYVYRLDIYKKRRKYLLNILNLEKINLLLNIFLIPFYP